MIDALALATTYVRASAPDGLGVEPGLSANIIEKLPVAVVSTSVPSPVSNGPLEASSAFTVAVSVYAGSRVEAARMAGDLFDGCLRSWRSRLVTEFGWVSRITHDSRHPAHVRSDLEADGTYRVDFTLDVIARN